MHREGGTEAVRRASDGERQVQRVMPAAGAARGGARRGAVCVTWCATESCARWGADTTRDMVRNAQTRSCGMQTARAQREQDMAEVRRAYRRAGGYAASRRSCGQKIEAERKRTLRGECRSGP
eukprot:6206939-Pleurochrysis_carterae.AAC.1